MDYQMRKVLFSSKRLDHGTPKDLYDQLYPEFKFTTDVCVDQRSMCLYCWPGRFALGLEWNHYQGPFWMNPPYGREIGKWTKKADLEARLGAVTVGLLPCRTDTKWFWENILEPGYEIRLIKGRVIFEGEKHGAPFPSCVVIFKE